MATRVEEKRRVNWALFISVLLHFSLFCIFIKYIIEPPSIPVEALIQPPSVKKYEFQKRLIPERKEEFKEKVEVKLVEELPEISLAEDILIKRTDFRDSVIIPRAEIKLVKSFERRQGTDRLRIPVEAIQILPEEIDFTKKKAKIIGTRSDPIGYFAMGYIYYPGAGMNPWIPTMPAWKTFPNAIPNLMRFLTENTKIRGYVDPQLVDITTNEIFNVPLAFITGYHAVTFDAQTKRRLREYIDKGGFLWFEEGEDEPDYPFLNSIKGMLAEIFPEPEHQLFILPDDHEIYHIRYHFNGTPYLEMHVRPLHKCRNMGIEVGTGKHRRLAVLVCVNTYSHGWDDTTRKGGNPVAHETALKFGVNVILYCLIHSPMVDKEDFMSQ